MRKAIDLFILKISKKPHSRINNCFLQRREVVWAWQVPQNRKNLIRTSQPFHLRIRLTSPLPKILKNKKHIREIILLRNLQLWSWKLFQSSKKLNARQTATISRQVFLLIAIRVRWRSILLNRYSNKTRGTRPSFADPDTIVRKVENESH